MDLTAVVAVWVNAASGFFYILPFFFAPKESLVSRSNVEAHKYEAWAKTGHLTLTEGNEVDFAVVIRKIKELAKDFQVKQIAYDPAFAIHLAQQLRETDGLPMLEVRQGFTFMNEPCHELETAIISNRVRHGGHPVLRWNMDCVTVRKNDAGHIRPVKPDRMKNSNRIDGVVATLMAVFGHLRAPVKPPSIYESRGPITFRQ